MKVVEVTWLDYTHHDSGWRSKAHYKRQAKKTPLAHTSVGYLLADKKDYIVIYQSFGAGTRNIAEVSQIPRAAVTRVEVLRE